MDKFKVNIELNQLKSTEYEVTKFKKGNYTKKSFYEFKDISEALQFFEFSTIREELEKIDETLLLNIQINGQFENLRQSELHILSKKCKNKSIVALFSSKSNDKFSIYWKSKELSHFLTLMPYQEYPNIKSKRFFEFLAIFLAESLSNGHLGVLSAVQHFAKKGKFVQLHLIADDRDYNLLLIASESGENEIVKILLDQNIETEYTKNDMKIKSQDLAWRANNFDIVLTLMKAGLTFPKFFNIDECSVELKTFCEHNEELHSAIMANDDAKIKRILNQKENSHPFYNRFNESASKIALTFKLIDKYQLLTTHKIFLGRNEIFHDFWNNFSEDERDSLRKIHFKNSVHMPEKHINELTNASSVSHDDKNALINLNMANYAFGILNQIALIRIILMIVAASKTLKKIIFDFKSTSVDVVDPTADSNTRGLFYTKGIICVAAGFLINQSSENETFGTLAHELCHYAMNLVYRNRARPYKKNDKQSRREFTKVAKACEQNRGKEEIIDMAFRYPPKMQHAELIVRVPHLLALYHNQSENLNKARENFSELFKFYEQKVAPEMEAAIPKIEKEIEQIEKRLLKNKIITILTITLSMIIITVGFFLMRSKKLYTFDELSRLDQNKIRNATVSYKSVNVQLQDLFPENSTIYQNITPYHISNLLDDQIIDLDDKHFYYLNDQIVHSWTNLTKKLSKKFLSYNLKFQNERIKFGDLFDKIPKAFEYLSSQQIISVLDGIELIIDKIISNTSSYYVERNFWNDKIFEIYFDYRISGIEWKMPNTVPETLFKVFYEDFLNQSKINFEQKISEIQQNGTFKYYFENDFDYYFTPVFTFKSIPYNFNKIFTHIEQKKLFILSSEAGTGKTTTFEQMTLKIKKKFPTRWVSYIDLKDFTNFYNKTDYLENNFKFLEDIFELTSKTKFERAIFHELFKLGQIVILWNGFDEISPNYSDFILHIFESIFKNLNNIQLVCTRPLYKDHLEKRFGISSFNLVPFDKENQEEFLNKIFNNSKIYKKNHRNYIDKVHKIVNILSAKTWSGESREDFNTPLMLEMIADLIANEIEIYENENIWQIYEKFVKRKIKIWGNRSDFATQYAESSVIYYRKFDMLEFYQMHAIKKELPNLITILGGRDKSFIVKKIKIMRQKIPQKLTNVEISRMGILYINGENQIKFSHNTFAEFFVAQFLIESIYNSDEVDSEDTKIIFQLFIDITEFYISRQVIITNFIKSFLSIQNSTKSEGFNEKISDICRNYYKNFLFDLLKKKKVEIIEFWIDFFSKDHKLLVDLLHVHENQTLYTGSFNYAYNGGAFDRTALKKISKNFLNEDEYEKFIRGNNQKGIILFSLYLFYRNDVDENSNRTVFHDEYDLNQIILNNTNKLFVFKTIIQNLTKAEVKELLLSTSSPLSWTELDLMKQENFWNIINSYLNNQEKKILMFNIFRKFSINTELWSSIQFFINKSKNIFNNSDVREMFQIKNILHWSAVTPPQNEDSEAFQIFWNFFVNHSNVQEQKDILLYEIDGECFDYEDINPNQNCYDYTKFNVFHLLLTFSRNEVNYTINFYEQYFNKTEMQRIVTKSNDYLFFFMKKNYDETVDDFAIYLRRLFEGNEKTLQDFLSSKIYPTNLNVFEFIYGYDNQNDILYNAIKKRNNKT